MITRVQLIVIFVLFACNSRKPDVLSGDQLAIRQNSDALRIYMHKKGPGYNFFDY